MNERLFEEFREIIYRESGIVLEKEKLSLLTNRIQKRLRQLNISDEKEYLEIIETDATGEELRKLVEVVSTNVTFFYREKVHFDILSEVARDWVVNNKKEVKIWCAAASTGEEPYTIAFTVASAINLQKTAVRILATDINTQVLAKASNGHYQDSAIATVPQNIKDRYLVPVNVGDCREWEVAQEIKRMVLFKKLNLVDIPYRLHGPIDIIFCRNVMIYFDLPTRQKIINEMVRLLSVGGHLILSLSESLLGVDHPLEKKNSSVFIKRG